MLTCLPSSGINNPAPNTSCLAAIPCLGVHPHRSSAQPVDHLTIKCPSCSCPILHLSTPNPCASLRAPLPLYPPSSVLNLDPVHQNQGMPMCAGSGTDTSTRAIGRAGPKPSSWRRSSSIHDRLPSMPPLHPAAAVLPWGPAVRSACSAGGLADSDRWRLCGLPGGVQGAAAGDAPGEQGAGASRPDTVAVCCASACAPVQQHSAEEEGPVPCAQDSGGGRYVRVRRVAKAKGKEGGRRGGAGMQTTTVQLTAVEHGEHGEHVEWGVGIQGQGLQLVAWRKTRAKQCRVGALRHAPPNLQPIEQHCLMHSCASQDCRQP